MTPTPDATDPRRLFGRALDQAQRLVDGVAPEQLDGPTLCADYDVRALLGHIVAVLRRITHMGSGGRPFEVPSVVDDVAPDSWPQAYREARAKLEAVWSDDAVLDRMLPLPWGTLPGAPR